VPDLHIPAGAGSHQQAYLATPPLGEGPWPGVVVLQDAFGMTDDLREHTDRLATAGYVAVAPRLYTARGGGPRCVAAVFRAMASGNGPVFDDIDAARGWLADRDDCTGRVGVIGFCQGGGFALIAAARHDFAATAPNYGHVPTDAERDLEGICPVVASFGARDVALKGHPERLEAALDALGVEKDIKTYPTAAHSFHERFPAQAVVRRLGAGYDHDASEDAWGRILRFFDTHLRSA
jgi:carboxymethylenebutenolidase